MAKAQFDTLPAKKLAYLTMRKSGCTSIKQAFAELRGLQQTQRKAIEIHGYHPYLVMAEQLKNKRGWFKFTVVREPITRFLSFYCNKILDQNINGNPTIRDRQSFGYLPNMPLECAIDSLVNPAFRAEPHAVPQSEVVARAGFELDYVGRLEQLGECVQTIKEKTGVELPLGHLNQRRGTQPLISEQQFHRLAEYYRRDIEQFGYPANYNQWREQFVDPHPQQFHAEPGFEFEEEGKLLSYSVERTDRRFVIDLRWRVAPTQTRTRYFRVVRNSGAPQRHVLFYLKANRELKSDCDEQMEVRERFAFQFSRIPEEYRDDDLFFEVYFWSPERQAAKVIGSRGNNKLLIGLQSKQDIETGVIGSVYHSQSNAIA